MQKDVQNNFLSYRHDSEPKISSSFRDQNLSSEIRQEISTSDENVCSSNFAKKGELTHISAKETKVKQKRERLLEKNHVTKT